MMIDFEEPVALPTLREGCRAKGSKTRNLLREAEQKGVGIMETPLENMKILDFTRVLAGPFATMILGDLGAEVIKVEPPNGDDVRTWPPILEKGESGYFMIVNRNKKSITLNQKKGK